MAFYSKVRNLSILKGRDETHIHRAHGFREKQALNKRCSILPWHGKADWGIYGEMQPMPGATLCKLQGAHDFMHHTWKAMASSRHRLLHLGHTRHSHSRLQQQILWNDETTQLYLNSQVTSQRSLNMALQKLSSTPLAPADLLQLRQVQHFAEAWDFNYTLQTPHYPQSSWLAEKTVQTAKHILNKAKAGNHTFVY